MGNRDTTGLNGKAFVTWKNKGIQFLARPSNTGVHVLDEDGFDYGDYSSVQAARGFFLAKGKASINVLRLENARPIEKVKLMLTVVNCVNALQAGAWGSK